MSVAKPLLDYIETIKVRRDIRGSRNEFWTILGYNKRYINLLAIIVLLSALKAYMFTLEPLYTTQIIDKVVVGGVYALLPDLVLKIFVVVVGVGLLTFGESFLNGYVAELIIRDIRSNYYRSLEEKSFGFYDSNAVGDLISRATMDLQAVQMFSANWISSISDALFTAVAVLIVMFSISPTMSLISLVPLPLIVYLQIRQFTAVRPLLRKMMLILGKLGAYVQQDIIGMKNVRIFKRENDMEVDFKIVEDKYVGTAIQAGKVQARYMPSAQAILQVGMAFVYVYGVSLVVGPIPALTIGELTLYSRYMQRLVGAAGPIQNLTQHVVGAWVNASASIERINEISNAVVDVKDGPEAREILIERGEVEFRNVYFGYTEDTNVLTNISFKVRPGEKIAILGATGSGKTSLIYLIPRFYDAHSGSITIDGIDIKDFKIDSLRKQVGLVLQDVFLFAGTIYSNIAFGKPDASLDEVIYVAKLARIHDFVDSLPEKYNTMIGERGVTLSGGQKQRLTIARAILTNPKILILDDSLSFVDAKTEHEIQQAIEEAMKARTTFIIAQRLSTIKNADKILVLEKGKVVEFGTHSELMVENGIYKKIYETQFLEKISEDIVAAEVK
jgi:ATP-binding cassette subfamily B protein